jgi:hypothetical protein
VVFGESSMALAKVFDAESISKTTKTQDIFQLISQITSLIGKKQDFAAFFFSAAERVLKNYADAWTVDAAE